TSALQDIRKVAGSGGSSTIPCDENIPSIHMPTCWHTALPHNSTVEQNVTSAIKAYIAKTNTKLFAPVVGGWHVHGGDALIRSDGMGNLDWYDGPCDDSN